MAVNYNQLRIDTPETRAALEQEYANRPLPTVRSQGSPSTMGNLFNVGASYLLGREGEQAFEQLGQQAQTGAERIGTQAVEATEFKPYTVTSGLANIAATPEGGLGVTLSPEQQAAQQQLLGQATGLFGQVGADPSTAQAQLFEQMRAVQRPEEERQRLALEERLLSQGRLGLSSAAYGGASPELLAQETARQEAMARANLAARQQAQAEQLQAGQLGGMLQAAGYQPQAQALDLFGAANLPAQLQQRGQLGGAELQALLGQTGLEGYLQAAELGQAERLANLQTMANILGGSGTGATARTGLVDQLLGLVRPEQDTQNMLSFPDTPSSSFLGGSGFLSSILLPEVTNPYDTGSLFSGYVPSAIPTPGQPINLGNIGSVQDIDSSGFNQSAFNAALGL